MSLAFLAPEPHAINTLLLHCNLLGRDLRHSPLSMDLMFYIITVLHILSKSEFRGLCHEKVFSVAREWGSFTGKLSRVARSLLPGKEKRFPVKARK